MLVFIVTFWRAPFPCPQSVNCFPIVQRILLLSELFMIIAYGTFHTLFFPDILIEECLFC